MKLVIVIPDHIYEHAKNMSEDSNDEYAAMRAIAVGQEERPHGKWMKEIVVEEPRKNKRAYARCTACGVRFNHYKFAVLHFVFCPICGARMKEGEAE